MVTIKDVAKKAGLSVSTVSRYLNDHPYISDDNKKKIKEVMEDLNYVPSTAAKQLRGQDTKMIGVIVSRITNPFFTYLVDAIEKVAKARGYKVLIVQSYDDSLAEERFLEMLRSKVVDGIIMCSVECEQEIIEGYQKYGPIILCNESFEKTTLPQIILNQTQATYDAINYLVRKGHKRIAYCTGGRFDEPKHGVARNKGFIQSMEENELDINYKYIFDEVHTIKDGERIAERFASFSPKVMPTAIFTGSDEIASGFIAKIRSLGFEVPNDISVIGFDDQPLASLISVPLTTIKQPVEEIGKVAIEYLLATLNNQTYQIDEKELELKLVIRESA